MRKHWAAALSVLLIALAAGRIAASSRYFTAMIDEPPHIATGMEFLSTGKYQYEHLTPPLARVSVAFLPWLDGKRTIGYPSLWDEGAELVYGDAHWRRTLALARAGTLPFLILACLVVFSWGKWLGGPRAGMFAVLLLTFTPFVLAQAGLATTDMASGATTALAIYAWIRWLESPVLRRAVMLGGATALAVLVKFSVFLYLPVAALAVLAFRLLSLPRGERWGWVRRIPLLRQAVAGAATMAVVLWAGYGFSIGAISDPKNRPYEGVDALLGSSGVLHDLAYTVLEAPVIPMPEFISGVRDVLDRGASGGNFYLLGEVSKSGSPWFFPVALAVKMPVALFLLVGVALLVLLRRRHPLSESWRQWATLAVPFAIVAAGMTSPLTIGLRHMLPAIVVLALAAGYGLDRLVSLGTPGWTLGALAAVSIIVPSLRSHPDYLTYFNLLAGSRPDHVLVGADLSWGQDLGRLADSLKARGVGRVTLAVGNLMSEQHLRAIGFTEPVRAEPWIVPAGWAAFDLQALRLGYSNGAYHPPEAFNWVEQLVPADTIGKTILLYHISPDTSRQLQGRVAPP